MKQKIKREFKNPYLFTLYFAFIMALSLYIVQKLTNCGL